MLENGAWYAFRTHTASLWSGFPCLKSRPLRPQRYAFRAGLAARAYAVVAESCVYPSYLGLKETRQ